MLCYWFEIFHIICCLVYGAHCLFWSIYVVLGYAEPFLVRRDLLIWPKWPLDMCTACTFSVSLVIAINSTDLGRRYFKRHQLPPPSAFREVKLLVNAKILPRLQPIYFVGTLCLLPGWPLDVRLVVEVCTLLFLPTMTTPIDVKVHWPSPGLEYLLRPYLLTQHELKVDCLNEIRLKWAFTKINLIVDAVQTSDWEIWAQCTKQSSWKWEQKALSRFCLLP